MHYSELEISVKFINEKLKGAIVSNIYRHKYGTLFKLYGCSTEGLFFSREKRSVFPVNDISLYERKDIGKIEEALRKYICGKRITGAELSYRFGKSVTLFFGQFSLLIKFSTAFMPVIEEDGIVIWPQSGFLPEEVALDIQYFPPQSENACDYSDLFIEEIKLEQKREKERLFEKEKKQLKKNISFFYDEFKKAKELGFSFSENASLIKMWLYTLDSASKKSYITLQDMSGCNRDVFLDKSRTILENMNRFFKLASKYKKGEIKLKEMLADAEKKLEELSIESFISESISDSLSERKDVFTHKPYHIFISSWGSVFFVGKTASDNDELTFKISSPHDIWFHAKDYSGSHVIFRKKKNEQATERDINTGCMLAINYSKAKKGGEGEVWYSERKFIKKSKGMAHGAVLITKGKSRYVIFDQTIMDSLKKE